VTDCTPDLWNVWRTAVDDVSSNCVFIHTNTPNAIAPSVNNCRRPCCWSQLLVILHLAVGLTWAQLFILQLRCLQVRFTSLPFIVPNSDAENPVTWPVFSGGRNFVIKNYSDEFQVESVNIMMPTAVSCRPLTAEARVRSRVSPCGICGGPNGNGTDFSPSTSVFPCQFHSTGAPLQGKTKKLSSSSQRCTISLQGCGASVASTARPFNKKRCPNLIWN
jgi:hypothetical protein